MFMPAIRGIIDRRILANFRIDPKVMAAALPAPFRPQIVKGFAIGGICLIRLTKVRPRGFPIPWGLSSENAAHRIAVEWDEGDAQHHGVFVPRRDTNSRLNTVVGGRLFPGVQNFANFQCIESSDELSVTMRSTDDQAHVHVKGTVSSQLPDNSVFDSLAHASNFFKLGAVGFSPSTTSKQFDGIELRCDNWEVQSLSVTEIRSSYFDDTSKFPKGTAEFDNALLMRGIRHEWHSSYPMCCPPSMTELN